MTHLDDYLAKRGITDEQMDDARKRTQAYVDSYKLREARKAAGLTQVEIAERIGVSQNRISRMEDGDLSVMSVDSIRRYIEALGGKLMLVADLPTGAVKLVS